MIHCAWSFSWWPPMTWDDTSLVLLIVDYFCSCISYFRSVCHMYASWNGCHFSCAWLYSSSSRYFIFIVFDVRRMPTKHDLPSSTQIQTNPPTISILVSVLDTCYTNSDEICSCFVDASNCRKGATSASTIAGGRKWRKWNRAIVRNKYLRRP